MQVVHSAKALSLKECIISIGNFDGVHLGHHMLLRHMMTEAKNLSKPSIILTFFPPSKHYFTGADFLSTEEEKLALFEPFSPDAVIIVPFNEAYTKTPKEDFLNDLKYLNPHTIIVGENFRFGFERQGSLNDLSKHTGRLEVFNLKHGQGQPISSSRLRNLLSKGAIEEANSLLGRAYQASGTVIKGDQRGRGIGFPTANIVTNPNKALPLGVFAVKLQTTTDSYLGMANVGPRPSFPNDPPSLEVHLFDASPNLYNEHVFVSFYKHLRQQRKFANLDDLKTQLSQDQLNARAFFQTTTD